ncbi:hypothetical protein SAMN05216388_10763 [Halorientalis persicus]|uniref:Uncharacterized protein n=2 Tax=Halorientalis persicus TaxID=1367881 RepID=A0A1H8WTI0_9EURY|nr:hypothetical protein SAMN05216388_10763 [Halorientalis persicus]
MKARSHQNGKRTMNTESPAEESADTSETQVGQVGRDRTPVSMPSRDGRVATVPYRDGWEIVVGYRWAVYALITPEREIVVFRGWKTFSEDTRGSITALEAVASQSLPGAPAIDLGPTSPENPSDPDASSSPLVQRTASSALPEIVPEAWIKSVV